MEATVHSTDGQFNYGDHSSISEVCQAVLDILWLPTTPRLGGGQEIHSKIVICIRSYVIVTLQHHVSLPNSFY